LLFRFFDILKPFPVNWCDENLHGGIGVVVDDLVAGIMAYIVLRLLLVIGL
jgi:phosphatidylglycerophosphatase A